MKKITTLIALACVSSLGFAQSQRLCLGEEFTQASCGPCAAQNPAYNAIIAANTNKIVTIKYQTSWPGVDPMNAQTQSEVGPRVSYYSVSGVPNARIDGTVAVGAPSQTTQTAIDNEYNVPSSFTMNLVHSFSSDMDSIFITCDVTCSQNITMTTPKLHVVMVEETIKFANPPGSNGEKEFFNVMRKMYPNSSGTTLTGTWTTSQTQNFTFSGPIPSYVYNKGQIGIVAFIQDDATKNVKQAAWSAPLPLANDAGVTMITGITSASCNTTFTPTVTLQNFGTATLTSCTINYKIDNQTVQTLPWTGSLAPNATTTVTLPQQTTTPGGHTFTAYPTMPNAGTDYNGINDQTINQFLVITTNTTAYPMAQPFTTSTFPPTDWALSNPDAGPTWSRISNVGAYGQSPLGCARMDFFNSTEGNIDDLFGAPVNMSTTTGNSFLTFDVAYAPYSTAYADTLRVYVSTDCGNTWTQVYYKSATTLATAPATTSSYTPTSAQWRHEVVSMTPYNGQASVIVKFSGRSGYGNMLYVDNINISASSSIDDLSAGVSLSVYPNPMNDNAVVTINLLQNEEITLNLVNMLGETVQTINAGKLNAGSHNISLDASNLSGGVYFVKVNAGAYSVSRKVVVEK